MIKARKLKVEQAKMMDSTQPVLAQNVEASQNQQQDPVKNQSVETQLQFMSLEIEKLKLELELQKIKQSN